MVEYVVKYRMYSYWGLGGWMYGVQTLSVEVRYSIRVSCSRYIRRYMIEMTYNTVLTMAICDQRQGRQQDAITPV